MTCRITIDGALNADVPATMTQAEYMEWLESRIEDLESAVLILECQMADMQGKQ